MKTRKFSIRLKLTIVISLVSILGFGTLGVIVYNRVGNMLIEQMKQDAMAMARVAAYDVNGEDFASISSPEDEVYSEIYNVLDKYKKSGNIEYIYSMKLVGEKQVVFVIDTDEEDPAAFEEEYEWLDDFEDAFNGEVCADKEITSDEWGKYFSAYAPIMKGDEVVGIVGFDISIESVNEKLGHLRILIIILVIAFSAECIIAAAIIGTIIGNNLKKMNTKVKEINSGDGDLTKKLNINSGDELEVIAGEFNSFIDSIRNLVVGVADTTGVVTSNSDEMDSAVKDCHDNLSYISDNLQDLSATMQETSAKTNLIANNIDCSKGIVEEIYQNASSNAREALEISSEVARKRKEIVNKATKAEKIVENLRKELEEAARNCEGVHKVAELSDEILAVSDTTRMLSLNANIEAAKAGAAGRGFAVIADDVQKLSDQITVLVEDIQETNMGVISSVETLIDCVTKTSDFLKETVMEDYQGYENIGTDYSDRMMSVSEVLSNIDSDLQRVNELFGDMKNDANEIDTAVEISTEKITNVASSSVTLEESMNSLSGKAGKNNEVAEALRNTVEIFKY